MNKEYRYRIILALAGLYNFVFALWFAVSADTLFALVEAPVPFPSVLIIPLSLAIAAFGVMYFYIAWKPEQSFFLLMISLLGKSAPPLLMILLIDVFDWPVNLLIMVFFNDMIWWIPFFLFLRKSYLHHR